MIKNVQEIFLLQIAHRLHSINPKLETGKEYFTAQ